LGSARPNIVFILADDLGYCDLGCYGQRSISTPNIDAMAADGIRFTQCYTGSPVCAPSRSVLMTGQHAGHTRIRENFAKEGGVLVLDDGPPQRRGYLEQGDTTVAEVLKGAGYATGCTGKWGLGEAGTAGVPNRKGFDEWFGYLNQRRAHSYYPAELWLNEERKIIEGNQGGQRGQYSHDLFTEFALDFIKRQGEHPFFLYLAYTIPHARYEVPSVGPYANRPWPEDAKVYAAMVSRMDRDVGRLLGLLGELGIDDRTLVFLCSDNGAAQPWEGIFDSCGQLRGKKGDLYEGGIRTPMIVRWPGHVPGGRVSDAVWHFADFLPTAAELAGAKPLSGIDGVSVLSGLLGKRQASRGRPLYWEHHGRGFEQAIRMGRWKAIRRGLSGSLELFDLGNDPGEQRDLANRHPDVVKGIERYLASARTESEWWPLERSAAAN